MHHDILQPVESDLCVQRMHDQRVGLHGVHHSARAHQPRQKWRVGTHVGGAFEHDGAPRNHQFEQIGLFVIEHAVCQQLVVNDVIRHVSKKDAVLALHDVSW